MIQGKGLKLALIIIYATNICLPARAQTPPLRLGPTPFGSLKKIQHGTSSKTIVHIQDIHYDRQAQRNISSFVEKTIETAEFDVVALESAFSEINLEPYRTFPHPNAVHQAAKKLLKKNKISGPIHALLKTPNKIPTIAGIDNELEHKLHTLAQSKAKDARNNIHTWLIQKKENLQKKKAQTFSSKLLSFDKAVQSYQDGNAPFEKYVKAINHYHPNKNSSLELFLLLIEEERSFDLEKIKKEKNVRELHRFLGHQKKKNSLNAYKFIKTLHHLEQETYAKLSKSKKEFALIKENRHQHLIEKLTNLSLSVDEWNEYQSQKKPALVPLKPFEDFYFWAQKRDSTLSSNTKAKLNQASTKNIILVTGGFHSQAIWKNLKEHTIYSFVPNTTLQKESALAPFPLQPILLQREILNQTRIQNPNLPKRTLINLQAKLGMQQPQNWIPIATVALILLGIYLAALQITPNTNEPFALAALFLSNPPQIDRSKGHPVGYAGSYSGVPLIKTYKAARWWTEFWPIWISGQNPTDSGTEFTDISNKVRFERYLEAKPLELEHFGLDENAIAWHLQFVSPEYFLGYPLIKALAQKHNIPDNAFRSILYSKKYFRDFIDMVHPYVKKAQKEFNDHVTLAQEHSYTYFLLKERKARGESPPVLINVDPHGDLDLLNEDKQIKSKNWVSRAIQERLIDGYVQIDLTQSEPVIKIMGRGQDHPLNSPPNRNFDDIKEFIGDRDYHLTIDMDSFSAVRIEIDQNEFRQFENHHVDDNDFEEFHRPIEQMVTTTLKKLPAGVSIAVSPDYLDPLRADTGWKKMTYFKILKTHAMDIPIELGQDTDLLTHAQEHSFIHQDNAKVPRKFRSDVRNWVNQYLNSWGLDQTHGTTAADIYKQLRAAPIKQLGFSIDEPGPISAQLETFLEPLSNALPILKGLATLLNFSHDRLMEHMASNSLFEKVLWEMNPYRNIAKEKADEHVTTEQEHIFAYYALLELFSKDNKPRVVVNIDPHEDIGNPGSIKSSNWVLKAFEDGFIFKYVHIRQSDDPEEIEISIYDNVDGRIDVPQTDVQTLLYLLNNVPYLLTVDADAFSLRHSPGNYFTNDFPSYHTDPKDFETRFQPVLKILQQATRKPDRVIGALSPTYTQPQVDEEWDKAFGNFLEETFNPTPEQEDKKTSPWSIVFWDSFKPGARAVPSEHKHRAKEWWLENGYLLGGQPTSTHIWPTQAPLEEQRRAYQAATPANLEEMGLSSDNIGFYISALILPDFLQGLPLLKSLALSAGLSDDQVTNRFGDKVKLRNLLRHLHPYREEAIANTNLVSFRERHDWAYYVLRALRKTEQEKKDLPIIINFDSHQDLLQDEKADRKIAPSQWVTFALNETLADGYINITFDRGSDYFAIYYFNGRGILKKSDLRNLTLAELKEFVKNRNYILSFDADFMSVGEGKGTSVNGNGSGHHVKPNEWRDSILTLLEMIKESTGKPPLAVPNAVSSEYLNEEADEQWIASWKEWVIGIINETFSNMEQPDEKPNLIWEIYPVNPMAVPAKHRTTPEPWWHKNIPTLLGQNYFGTLRTKGASLAKQKESYRQAEPANLAKLELTSDNIDILTYLLINPPALQGFPLMKALARAADIDDETVTRSFADKINFRNLIRDITPFRREAKEDEWISFREQHSWAYYSLLSMVENNSTFKDPNVRPVVINFDSHHDTGENQIDNDRVTSAQWADIAFEDNLLSEYFVVGYSRTENTLTIFRHNQGKDKNVTYTSSSLKAGHKISSMQTISLSEFKRLIRGQDSMLTFDADFMSVQEGTGNRIKEVGSGHHLKTMEMEPMLMPILEIIRQETSRKPLKVANAISPDYLQEAADERWIEDWKVWIGQKIEDTFKDSRPDVIVLSILLMIIFSPIIGENMGAIAQASFMPFISFPKPRGKNKTHGFKRTKIKQNSLRMIRSAA